MYLKYALFWRHLSIVRIYRYGCMYIYTYVYIEILINMNTYIIFLILEIILDLMHNTDINIHMNKCKHKHQYKIYLILETVLDRTFCLLPSTAIYEYFLFIFSLKNSKKYP
jgi:hypothetical protein